MEFIVGNKYTNQWGDELLCLSISSNKLFEGVPQPVVMQNNQSGQLCYFTAEGWYGRTQNEYPRSNAQCRLSSKPR